MRLGGDTEVVQVGGDQDALNLRLRESNALSDLLADSSDSHGVPAAVLVELLDQRDEHAQRLEVDLRIDGEIVALRGRGELLDQRLTGR